MKNIKQILLVVLAGILVTSAIAYATMSKTILWESGNYGISTSSPSALLAINAPAGVDPFVIGSSTKSVFKIDSNGYAYFSVPHAVLSSLEDQTCTVANTAYPVTFNNNNEIYQIGIIHSETVDNATTTIVYSGAYEITLSPIVMPDTVNKSINLWLRVNNAPVANSNTRIVLANNVDSIVSVSLGHRFEAGDTFQIMMASNDAGTILDYTAASAFAPASPSIIMTIKKVSN